MPPHVDSMVCLVDYRSATLKTVPSISNARHFLNIVQNHYVERLGRAIVVNLPFLLNFFYKAIGPFLDPVTKDKVRYFWLCDCAALRGGVTDWAFSFLLNLTRNDA